MQLNLAPDPTANATAPHPAEPAPKSPAANLASPLADAHGLGTLLSLGLGTVRSMDTAPTDAGSESAADFADFLGNDLRWTRPLQTRVLKV
jgi:hypothetical protein